MNETLKKFGQNLIATVLPAHCCICRHPIPKPGVCRYCLPELQELHEQQCHVCRFTLAPGETGLCEFCKMHSHIKALRFLWHYDPVAREYVRTMKYRPSLLLMKQAAQFTASVWDALSFPCVPTHVVPMPSTKERLKLRGIHHTHYFAKKLLEYSPSLSTAVLQNYLQLQPATRAQADLKDKTARIRNMKNAFVLRESVVGKNVLLIDDVITSGASVTAAALTLSAHSARSVSIFSLAIAPSFYANRATVQESLAQNLLTPLLH